MDNRTDLVEVILKSPDDVGKYLKKEFAALLKSDNMIEAIIGNLYFETQAERFEMIIDKLKTIIKGL